MSVATKSRMLLWKKFLKRIYKKGTVPKNFPVTVRRSKVKVGFFYYSCQIPDGIIMYNVYFIDLDEPEKKRSRISKSSVDGFISSTRENVSDENEHKIEEDNVSETENNQQPDEIIKSSTTKNTENNSEDVDTIINNIKQKKDVEKNRKEENSVIVNQSLQENRGTYIFVITAYAMLSFANA